MDPNALVQHKEGYRCLTDIPAYPTLGEIHSYIHESAKKCQLQCQNSEAWTIIGPCSALFLYFLPLLVCFMECDPPSSVSVEVTHLLQVAQSLICHILTGWN